MATTKETLEALQREEKKTGGSGAVPNTQKQTLLDLSELKSKHPDKEFRWVHIHNTGKAERRIRDGWSKLPADQGGRTVGNLAIFSIPRPKVESMRQARQERTARLLTAYKVQSHHEAEQMAKILRDRHGIDIDPKRLIAE